MTAHSKTDKANKVDDFDVFPVSKVAIGDGKGNGCAGAIFATSEASAWLTVKKNYARRTSEAALLQETLVSARLAVARFPLCPALKQIKARHREDDSWGAVIPPNILLNNSQQHDLRKSLYALKPTASVFSGHLAKA